MDNARYGIALTPMTAREARKYGIEKPWLYFSMTNVKENYAETGSRKYFKKMKEGVPILIDPEKIKNTNTIEEIVSWLKDNDGHLTKRELLYREPGKEFRDLFKEEFNISRRDLEKAIDLAIDVGLLSVIKVPVPNGGYRDEIWVSER